MFLSLLHIFTVVTLRCRASVLSVFTESQVGSCHLLQNLSEKNTENNSASRETKYKSECKKK